jgi:hypothetical protein
MSTNPNPPDHLRPLAPGYTPRQIELDAQMVALGRPALPIGALVSKPALEAHRAACEAWGWAHESTDPPGHPCKCGDPAGSCAARWLELRAQARAEDARLYEERYGGEAWQREQMRVCGFPSGLVDRAVRELRDTRTFIEARAWAANGIAWCLTLIGPPGCGKTQAATWAAFQLLTRNRLSSRCVPCRRVSEAPLYGVEAEEYRWRCRTTSVLVLDDLGEGEQRGEKRAAWRAWVDEVLSERYAKNLRTIITTNRSTAELGAWLGASLGDRLNEGVICSTNEPSLRGKPATEVQPQPEVRR